MWSSTPTTTTTRPRTPSPGTSPRRWRSGACSGPTSAGGAGSWSAAGSTRFIPNPTFDPVGKPGALQAFFKGKAGTRRPVGLRRARADPARVPRPRRAPRGHGRAGARRRVALPHARGRRARRRWPTTARPSMAAFTAFNRWLRRRLGLRVRGPPVRRAVPLPRGPRRRDRRARAPCWTAAPASSACGRGRCTRRAARRSPFTEQFDPFWARVAEAGITVAFHGGDSGYGTHVDAWEPDTEAKAFFATPLYRSITSNRAITETMLAMLCHRLLERHPRLRIASIENGSGWVSHLLRLVEKSAAMSPGWFARVAHVSCSTGRCGCPRSGRTTP